MAEPARPSENTLSGIRDRHEEIIADAVGRSMERTDEVAHHGDRAHDLLTKGFDFTLTMLVSAMEFENLELLENQLQWANRRLPHDGVQPEHLLQRFRILSSVLAEQLPKQQYGEVAPFLEWMIRRQSELSGH